MIIIKKNEATATLRRMEFHCVDATDGMTPETGEVGGQPQFSVNGAAWGNSAGVLVAIGNGRYYVELSQAETNIADRSTIAGRYKSANTAEALGQTIQIIEFPVDASVAALATVCTETRLAELDAANLPTDVAAIDVKTTNLPASPASEGNVTAVGVAVTAVGVIVTAIQGVLSGITSLSAWLRGLYRKDAMNATAKTELNTGGGTYDETNDSTQALSDKVALESTLALRPTLAEMLAAKTSTAIATMTTVTDGDRIEVQRGAIKTFTFTFSADFPLVGTEKIYFTAKKDAVLADSTAAFDKLCVITSVSGRTCTATFTGTEMTIATGLYKSEVTIYDADGTSNPRKPIAFELEVEQDVRHGS